MLVIFIIAARLILSAIFFIAGIAKLLDRHGSAQGMSEFGIPHRLVPVFALGIPLVELIAALLLVVSPISAWCGALLAGFLLICFTIGISINLLRGRRPACNCFGQFSPAPIRPLTVLRNVILLGLAAFVLWQTAPPPLANWLPSKELLLLPSTSLSSIDLVLGVALVVQGWLILQLIRQNGRLLVRIEKLEAIGGADEASITSSESIGGTPAPSFSIADLSGMQHTLTSLCAYGRPVLLLFTDPACAICATLLPDIVHWQQVYNNILTIAVISRGSPAEIRDKMAGYKLDRLLVATSDDLLRIYGVQGTPAAILIHSDGTLASEAAGGPGAVRHLIMRSVAASRSPGSLLARGEHAPVRRLVTVGQDEVELYGQASLLLFWDATCAYCKDVLDALKLPHIQDRLVAIQVIIITAEPEAVDLPYAIVHDSDRTIAGLFGVLGAPAAGAINSDGRIAMEMVLGTQAVRLLLSELAELIDTAL